MTPEPDLSALDILQRVDTSQERALAASAGADDDDHFTLADLQGEVFQDGLTLEPLRQMRDAQNRFRHALTSISGRQAR